MVSHEEPTRNPDRHHHLHRHRHPRRCRHRHQHEYHYIPEPLCPRLTLGDGFDGCILFDECHKAKNLTKGTQVSRHPEVNI